MEHGFMDAPDDCQWLSDTHLKGIVLPTDWAGFRSFVLHSHKGVDLYLSQDPNYQDEFLSVEFWPDDETPYKMSVCDGETGKPKGGLTPI